MTTENFNTFAASLSSGGQILATDGIVINRSGSSFQGVNTALTWVNVQAHGVLPANSGATNDTNMNALIAASTTGVSYYFPAGTYTTAAGWNLSGVQSFRILGDFKGQTGGTTITGNFAGNIINASYSPGAGFFEIRDISINNINANGVGVLTTNDNESLYQRVNFQGGNHNTYTFGGNVTNIGVSDAGFSNVFINCTFVNLGIGSYILSGSGATGFHGCDWNNCQEGVRSNGTGCSILGGRAEVCSIGLRLGALVNGSGAILEDTTISGLSMEACDCHVYVQSGGFMRIDGIGTHGSNQAPSGQSQYAIYVASFSSGSVNNCTWGGTFSCAAVYCQTGSIDKLSWNNTIATNGFSGGKTWDTYNNVERMEWNKCDYTERPDDTILSPSIRRDLIGKWIGKINMLAPMVEGQNLSGVNVSVANNVSSTTVTFINAVGGGAADISTLTATTGGSLANGTYTYSSTVLTTAGESQCAGGHAITLSGSNNAVIVNLFGTSTPSIYRIYRSNGTTDIFGNLIYQGYYELPLNTHGPFTDTGAAFTGLQSPRASGGDVLTGMNEPDTNYGVNVNPSWVASGASVAPADKATNGFTIRYSPNTPASGSLSLDWFLYR